MQVSSSRPVNEKGIRFTNIDREVTNRSGSVAAYGDVMMLDLAQSEAEVTSVDFGEDSAIWANMIAPTAGGVQGAIFCVVVEANGIADNATGTCRFSGIIEEAYTIDGSGTAGISIGDKLVVTTARNLDVQRASNEQIVARALEANSATSRTLGKVFFDGLNGFGFEP